MNREAKALAACVAYTRAQEAVRRLTERIGDCLSMCRGVKGEKTLFAPAEETHLHVTYRNRKGAYEAGLVEAPADLLDQCEYCARADKLIQERKAARQRLGSAKRAITRIGKGGAA